MCFFFVFLFCFFDCTVSDLGSGAASTRAFPPLIDGGRPRGLSDRATDREIRILVCYRSLLGAVKVDGSVCVFVISFDLPLPPL